MEGSKLLINEPPLQVLPTLARVLDVNKAIILQQVQYWIATSGHEINGELWIYNSYSEWSLQFPWLTPRGVRWHIKGLEKSGYLIAGDFNKDPRDHTKWYRINYEKLEALPKPSRGMSQSVTPPVIKRLVQVTATVASVPETTTETTTIDKHKNVYGEFKNVLLTETEYQKLTDKFDDRVPELIEKLSAGIESKGYKYKSHYATILNWVRRDGENGAHRGDTERNGEKDYGIGAPIAGAEKDYRIGKPILGH